MLPAPAKMSPDALVAVGRAYHESGNADAARLHYTAALLLDPGNQFALSNLGALFTNADLVPAAMTLLRRALAVDPSDLFARANYSCALLNANRSAEAKAEMESVLRAKPDLWGLWHSYGLAHYLDGSFRKALMAFDECLKGMSEHVAAKSDRSLALLAQGAISEGLESYEVRWQILFRSAIWKLKIPEWKGEDLANKRILLHHEQGFGDSIMLSRFVRAVADRGAKVVLAVPHELVQLFAHNFAFAGVDSVVDWEDNVTLNDSVADFHSPLLSVVRHLGIREPKDIEGAGAGAYLSAPPDTAPTLPEGFRIGLCWASGNHGAALAKRRRVVPLELLFPLAELPGVSLVSLQAKSDDILRFGAESFIRDPMGKVEDFADTAAVIAQLDLVVSVDSAVAHLAGALGRPTLMLGPYTRCWRWWGGESGWPWYEDFRIFAQERPDDWKRPTRQAIRHVERLLAERNAPKKLKRVA